MKKTIIILAIAAVALIQTSCLKEAVITSSMTEDVKNDIAKDNPDKVFKATLAGMYTDLQQYVKVNQGHNYFGQKSFDYLSSLMGNDMVMTGRYAMSIYHYLVDYRQETYAPTVNRWAEYYATITNSNNILKSISDTETAPAVLNYKAIALGLRGYAYWQLTNLYSYAYYVGVSDNKWGVGAKHDHSQDLCVPINTEKITGLQARSTLEKVYEQLISDLETSYTILKDNGKLKTPEATDFDGCVAANYLMRAYMVKQDWANAAKYAKVIMDNFPVLTSVDDITQGFSSINLPDVVFGCDITKDNETTYMSWFSQMDAYGEGYAADVYRVAFKPFVDQIASTDIRLQWFCCKRSTLGADGKVKLRDTNIDAKVEYRSVKFIGTGRPNIKAGVTAGWELGDYIYLRSEEAYLTYAEALAQQGSPEGKGALETFMKTRDASYTCTATSKAEIVAEINFQKRVEFWGEGMEYIDNRRLNIAVDRTDATWGKNNNHMEAARFKYEQEDLHFLYQLPLSEIENNNLIGPAHQNP